MSDKGIFPLGDGLALIAVEESVVACTQCHSVLRGLSVIGCVDRYAGKEPIAGWILCATCRPVDEVEQEAMPEAAQPEPWPMPPEPQKQETP